jgi:hypothetical protein
VVEVGREKSQKIPEKIEGKLEDRDERREAENAQNYFLLFRVVVFFREVREAKGLPISTRWLQ